MYNLNWALIEALIELGQAGHKKETPFLVQYHRKCLSFEYFTFKKC